MKIAVNTRFLLPGKPEGICWFSFEILQRLVRTHPEHDFYFLFDRKYDPIVNFGMIHQVPIKISTRLEISHYRTITYAAPLH